MGIFKRRKSSESGPTVPEIEQGPTGQLTAEVQINHNRDDAVQGLGDAALSGSAGFKQHESGLLVPDGSARVEVTKGKDGDGHELLVTDSRRNTLETVEENYNKEQERLASPLELSEQLEALDTLRQQARRRLDVYDGDDTTMIDDMSRDVAAIYRLAQAVKGNYGGYVGSIDNQASTVSDTLQGVVDQYSQFVPERFGEDSFISSMGGTVNIGPGGVVHSEGYNGSVLYEFARATQIARTIESMPKEIRQKVIEANCEPDAVWMLEEPVVVKRAPVAAAV